MVLHLDDHWRMLSGVNERARAELGRLFAEARVHVVWVDGRPSNHDPIDGLMHVTVVIVDAAGERRMSAIERLDHSVGGLAKRSVNHVYIFYSRVAYKARVRGRDVGTAIGTAIAHEVGHLLLLEDRHSLLGIMRAELDLESMVPEGFTKAQRDVIQSRLSAPQR